MVLRVSSRKKDDAQLNKMRRLWLSLRKYYFVFVSSVLCVGIIALFVACIIMDNATIDILNNFVSIILGIVALTTSIVSMYLSFYSITRAEETDKETARILQKMDTIQDSMNENLNAMKKEQGEIKNTLINYRQVTVIDDSSDGNWKKSSMK